MKKIDDNLISLYSSSDIKNRVEELGSEISEEYEKKEPIFIGVLNGSFIFMADLMRSLSIDCEMDFIKVRSYSGKKSSSNKLKKWGDQKWDYVSKGDKKKPKSKRGRYLPKSVRESLSPSEKASTNRKKRVANARSRRKATYSKSIARKVRNA